MKYCFLGLAVLICTNSLFAQTMGQIEKTIITKLERPIPPPIKEVPVLPKNAPTDNDLPRKRPTTTNTKVYLKTSVLIGQESTMQKKLHAEADAASAHVSDYMHPVKITDYKAPGLKAKNKSGLRKKEATLTAVEQVPQKFDLEIYEGNNLAESRKEVTKETLEKIIREKEAIGCEVKNICVNPAEGTANICMKCKHAGGSDSDICLDTKGGYDLSLKSANGASIKVSGAIGNGINAVTTSDGTHSTNVVVGNEK